MVLQKLVIAVEGGGKFHQAKLRLGQNREGIDLIGVQAQRARCRCLRRGKFSLLQVAAGALCQVHVLYLQRLFAGQTLPMIVGDQRLNLRDALRGFWVRAEIALQGFPREVG